MGPRLRTLPGGDDMPVDGYVRAVAPCPPVNTLVKHSVIEDTYEAKLASKKSKRKRRSAGEERLVAR